MSHTVSLDDQAFASNVQSGEFPVADFDHRAHVRLAYFYLTQYDTSAAVKQMRSALFGMLKLAGIDPEAKYHETLTEAWILAVHHFMQHSENCHSADQFIEQNEALLDSRIMLTHYSAELLFSDDARKNFIEPDLSAIPRHN